MYRPFITRNRVASLVVTCNVVSGKKKCLPARDLQIEPDRLAVRSPELMASDLPIDRPLVDLLNFARGDVDQPDAVDFMPRPFMAEHELVRVRWRELQMVQPGDLLVNDGGFSSLHIYREQLCGQFRFKDAIEIIGLLAG